MKLLLPVLGLFASLHAGATTAANYNVQKFPGKVIIEADINISAPPTNELDVLFVVDNSGSMSIYQRNLSTASVAIDKALSQMNRDFHLGVISTDVEGNSWGNTPKPGTLRGTPAIITAKDLPGTLAKNLLLGTDGSAVESPFASVQMALSEPMLSGANKGFLRSGAPLALVFLTDAEDQSQIAANDFRNFLGNLKGDLGKVTAFSWVVPSNDTMNCQRDDGTTVPQKIEDVTKSLNGDIYSVCDMNQANIEDFAQKLAKFGAISNPVPPTADFSEIPLTIPPVVSSIEVHFGSQTLTAGDLNEGWVYDAAKNAVILGQKIVWSQQPAGTKLVVSFVPAAWTK